MQDIDDKQVDQIVVYKIDRLTRSLADFARLVDRLDAAEASFVSVTQSFNTGTSMGRLTLNVLLSFAQFEREVTAERIRDKIAASKRKGLWMGGSVPLGYKADGRTLKVDPEEEAAIHAIFTLYETHGALKKVTREVEQLGIRSRRRQTKSGDWLGGNVLSRGHVHQTLPARSTLGASHIRVRFTRASILRSSNQTGGSAFRINCVREHQRRTHLSIGRRRGRRCSENCSTTRELGCRLAIPKSRVDGTVTTSPEDM